MKISKLIVAIVMFSSTAFGQGEDDSLKSGMMNKVEPEFSGTGENDGLIEFLEQNLSYPSKANNLGPEGVVVIQFKVLPTRNLSEFQVIHSVSDRIDKAVLDVLETSNGMWEPGTINGLPVPMKKEVAVIYKFANTEIYKTAQLNKSRADKLLKQGKYTRAIKRYSRAIESYPIYDVTIYSRGIAKYNSGDLAGARIDFERVAELDSHLADQMLTRLSSLAENNEW